MGFVYKKIDAPQLKVVDKVSCDRCQKELKKEHEGGFNDYGIYFSDWFEGYYHLKVDWGYSSGKDTEHHEAVICEACYDEIFRDVKVRVTCYMGGVFTEGYQDPKQPKWLYTNEVSDSSEEIA
jgi:hypothetical protein